MVKIPAETQSSKRPTQCPLPDAEHELDRKKEQKIPCATQKQCSMLAIKTLRRAVTIMEYMTDCEAQRVSLLHVSGLIRLSRSSDKTLSFQA